MFPCDAPFVTLLSVCLSVCLSLSPSFSLCMSLSHPPFAAPARRQTLRIRGEAEGEWGFLYRSTLGSLMSGLSEIMEVRMVKQPTRNRTLLSFSAVPLVAVVKLQHLD